MAAKDADLATDYADRHVFLSDDLVAKFAVTGVIEVNQETALPMVYLSELGPVGGVVYRMRGYDTDLLRTVYWDALEVDTAIAEYPGNSAALTNVVVSIIIV